MTPLKLNDRKSSFRQTDISTVLPSLHTHMQEIGSESMLGFVCVCVFMMIFHCLHPHALSPPLCLFERHRDACCIFLDGLFVFAVCTSGTFNLIYLTKEAERDEQTPTGKHVS